MMSGCRYLRPGVLGISLATTTAASMINRLDRIVQGSTPKQGSSVSQTIAGRPYDRWPDCPVLTVNEAIAPVELQVRRNAWKNLAMLRTLVGAIGTFEDLDFDCRRGSAASAVDEVCTRLIRSATPDATLAVGRRTRREDCV